MQILNVSKISAISLTVLSSIYNVPTMYLTKPNSWFRKHSGKREKLCLGRAFNFNCGHHHIINPFRLFRSIFEQGRPLPPNSTCPHGKLLLHLRVMVCRLPTSSQASLHSISHFIDLNYLKYNNLSCLLSKTK